MYSFQVGEIVICTSQKWITSAENIGSIHKCRIPQLSGKKRRSINKKCLKSNVFGKVKEIVVNQTHF